MSNPYPPASSPNDPLEPNSTPVFDTVAPGTPPPVYVPPHAETSQSHADVTKDQAAQTADSGKEEAAHVKDTAVDEAKNVAATAKTEAANVAGETKAQFKDLYRQSAKQLSAQAAEQQERAATGLQALSGEFRDMADNASGGVAADLVRQVADRAGAVGDWLGARGPGEVVSDVKSFARRKPGTFIAIAAITGLVAGRLTRSLTALAQEEGDEKKPSNADVPATRTTFTAADTYGTPDAGTSPSGDGGYGAVGTGTQAGPQIGTPPQSGSTPPPVTDPNTYAFGDDTPAYTTDRTPLHRASDDDTLPPRGAGI